MLATKPKVEASKLRELILDLSNNVIVNHPGSTVAISPALLYQTLLMIGEGCTGESQTQIDQALGLENADLIYAVHRAVFSEIGKTDFLDEYVSFPHAYGLFFDAGMVPKFKPWTTFGEKLNSVYRSGPRVVHFKRFDHEASLHSIVNAWVAGVSQQQKLRPFRVQDLKTDSTMLAISASNFFRVWRNRWDNLRIDFLQNSGTRVNIKGITLTSNIEYLDQPTFQLVRIPYFGKRFYLQLLVPKNGVKLKDMLSSPGICKVMSETKYPITLVKVLMPCFYSEQTHDLTQNLKDMGITTVFDKDKATLNRVTTMYKTNAETGVMISCPHPELYLGSVIQATRMDVGAEGHISLGHTAKPEARVSATRPFLYQVIDQETGLPIIAGTVAEFSI